MDKKLPKTVQGSAWVSNYLKDSDQDYERDAFHRAATSKKAIHEAKEVAHQNLHETHGVPIGHAKLTHKGFDTYDHGNPHRAAAYHKFGVKYGQGHDTKALGEGKSYGSK